MSRKILIVLVICALSMQALALNCFSCHDRNHGVNCVDRQHEEMVNCNDPVPSQDTNAFLGDYFKVGANTTGNNYVCLNVYANFSKYLVTNHFGLRNFLFSFCSHRTKHFIQRLCFQELIFDL